jgi:hypothetical protein
VLDALKHAIPVSDDQAIFWLHQRHPLWDAMFELGPEPVYGDAGITNSVKLHVGRRRFAVVLNAKPVRLDQWREPCVEVWHLPTVSVQLGPPQPLDACAGLGEVLAGEALAIVKFNEGPLQVANRSREARLANWREWVLNDGVRNAMVLRNYLSDLQVGAKVAQGITLDQLSTQVQIAMEKAESAPSDDDALEEFMVDVARVYSQTEDLEEAVEANRRREAELTKAAAWVKDKGSSRLRKALAANVLTESLGAYRDERIEAERPGWQWWRKTRDPAVKPIINPSEEDLDSLLVARELDPDAYLAYHPDLGPVVVAKYLDRHIIRQTGPFFDESL